MSKQGGKKCREANKSPLQLSSVSDTQLGTGVNIKKQKE